MAWVDIGMIPLMKYRVCDVRLVSHKPHSYCSVPPQWKHVFLKPVLSHACLDTGLPLIIKKKVHGIVETLELSVPALESFLC